ncbi:MAG: DUF3604 domain-containing protein [Pseudomonadaceae bacterium]|nr:DUF3604 domain-containing protein [Pseudomonadaceae bacterium]
MKTQRNRFARAKSTIAIAGLSSALLLTGCGENAGEPTPAASDTTATATTPVTSESTATAPNPSKAGERQVFFGDTHIHTTYSFDAFIFGTRTTPDDAHAYAKGEVIQHAAGFDVQLEQPLDFISVTDHATYLGMLQAMADPNSVVGTHPVADLMRSATTPLARRAAFDQILPRIGGILEEPDDLWNAAIVGDAWQATIESAERHNDPGNFTAFVGYEYTTSGPDNENLHRNVLFRSADTPDMPFSRLDSLNPEDLWDWMDEQRALGRDSLAIPHNSNGSDGWMFKTTTFTDEPLTKAYAEQRMRNEPIVEMSQVKGTSETHPSLSPNDEWAGFELMTVKVATNINSKPEGSYVREAYLRGLELEATDGFNPFRFGMIGASDTHNSAGSFDEANFFSKTGLLDSTSKLRGSVPLDKPAADGSLYQNDPRNMWGASGLAGVWAEENTRESLFDAMRRKETFATSGPRIRVRVAAGFDLDANLLTDAGNAAFEQGVPMGGDLLPAADAGAAPTFLVWAMRDPHTAPLQRIQMIKGWLRDGVAQEQVIDIACSDGAAVDPDSGRCPDNGARVDISDCSITRDKGDSELKVAWQDPQFDPDLRAFYYVRVLENPVCRWSTWDAVRAGTEPRPDMHKTLQDRAWTSPIWYVPG